MEIEQVRADIESWIENFVQDSNVPMVCSLE